VVNVIRVQVENPSELRNAAAYGASAIVRLQSSPDGITYGNEGTATLTDVDRTYVLYDTDGQSTTWYRTRYENGAGTLSSDWSDPFQAGDETGGLICSLYDVKQRLGNTTSTADDEVILDAIRAVTDEIESIVAPTWLIPRPTGGGTVTLRFDTESGYRLFIPQGIRSISAMNVADTDRGPTGGSYTAATVGDYYIEPSADRSTFKPGFWVRFGSYAVGTVRGFYDATYGVEITGTFGYAAVPPAAQDIGVSAVIRHYLAKDSAALVAPVGPEGDMRVIRFLSPSEERFLRSTYGWVDL
jgi:hypothetical protein